MKNTKVFISLALTAIISCSMFVGCGNKKSTTVQSNEVNSQEKKKDSTKKYTPVVVSSKICGKDYKAEFKESPKKAVSLAGFTTEMMLALGLQDKMAGYAFQDNEILPEFKDAYSKLTNLADTMPSKEKFLSVEPDFATGWGDGFSEKGFSTDFCKNNNVNIFVPKSDLPGATMETVYDDFVTLGKIFNVEDKAKEVTNNMKRKINTINSKIGKNDKPIKVFIYDSGEKAPLTACKGLPTDLIRLSGGKNIFDDGEKAWANVNWEDVIKRNPEQIIVMKYDVSDDAEGKIKFLKNNKALKNIDAIKNNKIFVMGLSDVVAGYRNSKAVETMAKQFYPERIK